MTTKTFIYNMKFQICRHQQSLAEFSETKILTSSAPPPNVIYVVMAMA